VSNIVKGHEYQPVNGQYGTAGGACAHCGHGPFASWHSRIADTYTVDTATLTALYDAINDARDLASYGHQSSINLQARGIFQAIINRLADVQPKRDAA
jgi:hypothetical protein